MEGQGQRMRLVEVVNGRATELFNHLGTADAKNYAQPRVAGSVSYRRWVMVRAR